MIARSFFLTLAVTVAALLVSWWLSEHVKIAEDNWKAVPFAIAAAVFGFATVLHGIGWLVSRWSLGAGITLSVIGWLPVLIAIGYILVVGIAARGIGS